MKKRTRSRELALQFLYQIDLCGDDLIDDAKSWIKSEERDAEAQKFALRLVEGTFEHWDEIDKTIQGVAQNWNISRMAVVDRNVLRLATYELLHCKDIPPKVAINEAIELGKRFSTSNSGAFINGILDKIMNRARPEGGAATVTPVVPIVQGAAGAAVTPVMPVTPVTPVALEAADADAPGDADGASTAE